MVAALGASAPGCRDRPVELTVFHTNDIHLHLRAAKSDPFGLGGVARLTTLLGQLRQKAPLSVTLDGGDWSEGTWYFSLNTGANMLRLFGMMGYDGVALGNHDFLAGPTRLRETIVEAQAPFPVLAANLDMSEFQDGGKLKRALPGTAIRQVGDLKIGLVGLTTYELLYDGYIAPVRITNPVDAATAAAKELRPAVDVLIVVSHNSFDVNVQLARAVPGVDAVVSGHSHRKAPKATLVKNAGRDVPVVETGEWGKFLGELKLEVSREKKWVRYASYRLHPVTPDIPEDPTVRRFVEEQDRLLNERFGVDVHGVVAEAELELPQQNSTESPLGNLAVKAYRAATGADLALEEISLTGVSVARGPATTMDLHDVVPHIYNPTTGKEWTLKVWDAKGSDLSLVINVFYTIAGLVPFSTPLGWLSAEGAEIVWDPSGTPRGRPRPPGPATPVIPAVKSIKIGGRALDPGARYRVALSEGLEYAIRTANEKFSLGADLTRVEDTGQEVWRVIVDYGARLGRLTRADLRVGGRAMIERADAAVYGYGVDWDGRALSVEVENQGLQPAGKITVRCDSGLNDDFVAFETPEQEWDKIGEAEVPSLAPQSTATVRIEWDERKLNPGYWPIRCGVSLEGDPYGPNDTASRVFRAHASR